MKHRVLHPQSVEGCYACRLLTVNVSPSATPTRFAGSESARINATEKQWDKDMPAYRRLRKNGLQPRSIDGAATLEQRATDRFEVEQGHLYSEADKPMIREGLQIARELKEDA